LICCMSVPMTEQPSRHQPAMVTETDDGPLSLLLKSCLQFGGIVQTIACIPFFNCGGAGIAYKINEGFRGAELHFGKLTRVVGPGTHYVNPCTTTIKVVSVQIVTMDVPRQQVMSRDNVQITINTVVFYQIVDVQKALFNVRDCNSATSNFAQSTLRTVLGEFNLDEIFAKRQQINERLTTIIDKETFLWGIKVTNVEIKDLQIPHTMERAMAATAEAQREGAAKVINAQAELTASATLAEAADVMMTNPMTLQLRYYQTLQEISAERQSTLIVPSELMGPGARAAEGFDIEKVLQMRKVLREERKKRDVEAAKKVM